METTTAKTLSVLDFDIENRPLSYLGHDWTTADVTAIAASWGTSNPMLCWVIGERYDLWAEQEMMLAEFVKLYNRADVVTGHYIRVHDLPHINGALLEHGMPGLGPKLTCDTKLDLARMTGVSKSQESLAALCGLQEPKIYMSQADWREANRLTAVGIEKTKVRVMADVRQHQALRLELLRRELLGSWKLWQP